MRKHKKLDKLEEEHEARCQGRRDEAEILAKTVRAMYFALQRLDFDVPQGVEPPNIIIRNGDPIYFLGINYLTDERWCFDRRVFDKYLPKVEVKVFDQMTYFDIYHIIPIRTFILERDWINNGRIIARKGDEFDDLLALTLHISGHLEMDNDTMILLALVDRDQFSYIFNVALRKDNEEWNVETIKFEVIQHSLF
jgi:hypothetical protein